MTSEPRLPANGSAPSTRHATVPLTKKPEADEPAPSPQATSRPPGHLATGERSTGHQTHRPWSARRIPSILIASVVLVAAVAALVDVIAVRAGRPAAAWRRQLADELATRPLNDIWMLTGAAVAAAVGVWLILLALTPGLRRWLPLRSPEPKIRPCLERDGAAALLRDAAMRVPGVGKARIRVHRHHVKARADVRFRDPQQVKNDLIAVLDEERDRLALARPPRIVVRVRQRIT